MELLLERKQMAEHVAGGVLCIGGRIVCHTCEQVGPYLLPEGVYAVKLNKVGYPHHRRMPCIMRLNEGKAPLGVIMHGNGVCRLTDGSIIVGQRVCRDLVIHSRMYFDRLFERLEKAVKRGEEVTLKVQNPLQITPLQ